MKRSVITCILSMAIALGVNAQDKQDKKELKSLEKQYAAFTSHQQFYDGKEWAMCKFSVVYKLSTAMIVKDMDKDKNAALKVKSSSGAYALLNGVTESDLQAITNKVAELFIKRMRDEAGVNISTWSSFKTSENTGKILKEQEDREIYSRSQGLAYAMSYDSTPHYNRVITLVPGGKALSKELKKNVMEFTLYIDFADMFASAEAFVKMTGGNSTVTHYKYGESAEQAIYPGVRLIPTLGSQDAMEAATNLGSTTIKGHDKNGYMFSVGLTSDIISSVNYADRIEPAQGNIPAILANRKNNKIEHVTTFNVYTTPEKYGEAVLDVANRYFDAVIKIYNANAK
jgi:hypothetical protein